MSVGGVWDDSGLVSNTGLGNRFLIDGKEKLTLSLTCAFATNGDAVLTPSNFQYVAERDGDWVDLSFGFNLATSAFTTASGVFEIRMAGLPAPSSDFSDWPGNISDARGIDLGGTTRHLGLKFNSAGRYFYLREVGDDNAGSSISATAFNAAGASDYVFVGNIRYKAA